MNFGWCWLSLAFFMFSMTDSGSRQAGRCKVQNLAEIGVRCSILSVAPSTDSTFRPYLPGRTQLHTFLFYPIYRCFVLGCFICEVCSVQPHVNKAWTLWEHGQRVLKYFRIFNCTWNRAPAPACPADQAWLSRTSWTVSQKKSSPRMPKRNLERQRICWR